MIVPMVYKPGILRDGSLFQSDYCIDGQWIRFVGGNIKKMKGQQEVIIDGDELENIIHIKLVQTDNLRIYFATQNTIEVGVINDLTNVTIRTNVLNIADVDNNKAWDSVRFIRNSEPCIAFLRLNNAVNLYDSSPGVLYWKEINDNSPFVQTPIGDGSPEFRNVATGGILFSNPLLFLYGDNGSIISSRTSDPLDFTRGEEGDAVRFKAGESKLLFGAQVRGGTNTPSFLFWNEDSVLYLTNVADGSIENVPIEFQTEVVTTDSSLISSRSVVREGSMFYWLGNNVIWNYNGIVKDAPNKIDIEHLIDNLDKNKRQKVFGYKVERYKEIRWAYPEIANAGNADIGCTREIVYNYDDGSWYDTAIRRDCVDVSSSTGSIFTYGEAASNFPFVQGNSYKRIWRHEVGWQELRAGGRIADIPSSFTTPYYGFVTFNPDKSGDVIDKYIELTSIEPDFPSPVPRERHEELIITVQQRKYPNTAITQSPDQKRFDLFEAQTVESLGKVDFKVQARFLTITFFSTAPFDVGTTLLHFKESGDVN